MLVAKPTSGQYEPDAHSVGQAPASLVWPARPALPNLPAGHGVFVTKSGQKWAAGHAVIVVADPEGQ